jgi:uncharacterized protein with FMN-binding domain
MLAGCAQGAQASDAGSAGGVSGDFSGTAKGNGGDVTITLTFQDGKITGASGVGEKETAGIGDNAITAMTAQMAESGTIDVDMVSGATITSTAVKKAAQQALEAAGVDPAQYGGKEVQAAGAGGCTFDVTSVNEWLNNSADLGEGTMGNAVAVIPINHVNGPREETKFYAFVNFKYKARNYIKYQITYLSCTCRSADVNYWQTAYVELTLPDSKDINDSKVRFLSFDRDSQDHYTAGFWGDSDPTPAGATYELFKAEYIPYFLDKDYKYIQTLSFVEDIDAADYSAGEGREGYKLDTFSGSSVSTNNIIRMLNALFKYHAEDAYFQN